MDSSTAHLIEAIVVGLPAIIAAVSSLRNGRDLVEHEKRVRARQLDIQSTILSAVRTGDAATIHEVREEKAHTRDPRDKAPRSGVRSEDSPSQREAQD
jgi:hypothetical protein